MSRKKSKNSARKRKQNQIKPTTNTQAEVKPSEVVEKKEEKARLQTQKKKISKWFWICLASLILSISSSIWGYWFLTESVPIKVTSQLTQVGQIEFSYPDKQNLKFSPLCGCFSEQEWGNWRGITFSSRNIEIVRSGEMKATGFLIFSSFPKEISWYPEIFKIKGTFYLLELPENEEFNPQYLVNGNLPTSYNLVSKKDSEEKFFEIISGNKINLELLGDMPLGSWIPVENSNVSLGYLSGQFPASGSTSYLEEKYRNTYEESEDGKPVWIGQGLPLGDFLGQNTAIWTEDEPTRVFSGTEMIYLSGGNKIGKKTIKCLIVNPPFSTRVAVIPTSEEIFSMSHTKVKESSVESYAPFISAGMMDNGSVMLNIKNQNSLSEEFKNIYDKLRKSDTVIADYKSFDTELGDGKMQFRYPPIPPNSGFNIFGNIDDLKVKSALGNLLIGSRSFGIESPADFELRNIKELEVRNGIIQIPIQISNKIEATNIQLEATSEVFINNESITRRLDNNKTTYDYSILVLTVIGAIVTLLSLVATVLSLRK